MMKKLVKRVLTSILASSFILSAFSGCFQIAYPPAGGSSSSSSSSANSTASSTASSDEQSDTSSSLDSSDLTSSEDSSSSSEGGYEEFEPTLYESNGENIADYSIVISQSANKAATYGASILQSRIQQAIGVELPIVTDDTAEGDLEIILGDVQREACEGINFNALGEESFQVKNVDNDLVIAGNDRGLLYGVYAYLEALGYRFYTVDTEKIPYEDEVFVPSEIELNWEPTFDYRETMYCMTWDADWAVSQRVNSDFMRTDLKNDDKYGGFAGYIGGSSWMVHTLSKLLPESTFTAHPEYFAEVDGARSPRNLAGHFNQPCLTNEGAYQLILKNALAKIASDRKSNILSVSENDGGTYCRCEDCEASYAQYGVSGTFYRFINRIAGDIAKEYPDVYIDTLSYHMSSEVPENLTLADNVIVRVCPEMCNFCTDPSTCEQLAEQSKRVTDFSKICNQVYVYFYPINWGNLYAALPSYEAMLYDMRFFAESGVKGVYAEGYSKENPEFGELKAYLMAKLMQNPYMSEGEYWYHYNDFLEGYYGDAAEYIAQYHTLTKEMIDKNMAENGHLDHWFSVEDNFDFGYDRKTHTYDMTYIDQINELWTEAVDCVVGTTLDHVKKSMIHWTYIELYNTMDNRMLYGDGDTRVELMERNEALYRDILKYGTTRKFDNAYDISTSITDFTLSPKKGQWLRP